MVLWKKILIGVFVLAVIVISLVGFGIFKAHQAYTEKIEPDMKRYVTMSQQEQDEYVMSRLGDFYEFVYQIDHSEKGRVAFEAMKNDPAFRQAGLAWGRSLCATIIKDNKELSSTLSAADKAKYAKEAEDLDDKGKRFGKEMKRIAPKQ